MGKWSGKSCRISTMMMLTAAFFLVEVVVGHIANSLALVADSFHMLSDVAALVVGLLSVRFAKKGRSKHNTYGWARAEVVGALVNAVFLIALCLTILVEAGERLIKRESIDDAYLLLYVGGAGLAINLLGLCLFHNHAHGHSHGSSESSETTASSGTYHGGNSAEEKLSDIRSASELALKLNNPESTIDGEAVADTALVNMESSEEPDETRNTKHIHQLNMRGVFLHVLGDALGSVCVMISAGLTIVIRVYVSHCHDVAFMPIEYHYHHDTNNTNSLHKHETRSCSHTDPEWLKCVDPLLSLLLVVIMMSTTIPLLKETVAILMQAVPSHMSCAEDMKRYIEKMKGVLGVHDLHIWKLAGRKTIGSLHVVTKSTDDFILISGHIVEYFHSLGVHSVTIQPEFVDHYPRKANTDCLLGCGPERDCVTDNICHSSVDSETESDVKATNGTVKCRKP